MHDCQAFSANQFEATLQQALDLPWPSRSERTVLLVRSNWGVNNDSPIPNVSTWGGRSVWSGIVKVKCHRVEHALPYPIREWRGSAVLSKAARVLTGHCMPLAVGCPAEAGKQCIVLCQYAKGNRLPDGVRGHGGMAWKGCRQRTQIQRRRGSKLGLPADSLPLGGQISLPACPWSDCVAHKHALWYDVE